MGTPTYSDFVRKLFNRATPPDLSKDFAHAILGINTEIYEYWCATDAVNGLEELGDMYFYIEALLQVCEDAGAVKPSEDEILTHATAIAEMGRPPLGGEGADVVPAVRGLLNDLLDHAKRWIGYGKAPEDLQGLLGVAIAVAGLANYVGPYPCDDWAKAERVNMAKLLKRYPGGEFDAYRAVVRDLDAERVVLQTTH